jgi:hypothetical protein
MGQEEAFKFYFDTRNNGALLLDPACLERLNVRSPALLPSGSPAFKSCEFYPEYYLFIYLFSSEHLTLIQR